MAGTAEVGEKLIEACLAILEKIIARVRLRVRRHKVGMKTALLPGVVFWRWWGDHPEVR